MFKVFGARVAKIPTDQIDLRSEAAREDFDSLELYHRAHTINRFSSLKPLLVRPTGDRFEVVVGESQFLALRILRHALVPCVVMKLDDAQCALAREAHEKHGIYIVITPKAVVCSLGREVPPEVTKQ